MAPPIAPPSAIPAGIYLPNEISLTHFRETLAFAESVGALKNLNDNLDFLRFYGYGTDPSGHPADLHTRIRCLLYRDFAPYSFEFALQRSTPEGWTTTMHGGLIYSGPGQPLDGSAPALSVHIAPSTLPTHSWSIHT